MTDVLSHFGELDELIQLVYQGFDRFIVLSTVCESSWSVYVGLKGPEGRWWRGSWSAHDVSQFIGSTSSSQLLAGFAHELSEAFVHGELCIGDWAPDKGAKLTLKPASQKPVHIPLVELSAKEAASHATTILSAIALQAQTRKCRLNPPSFSFSAQATTAASGPSRNRSVAQVDSPKKKAHISEPAVQPKQEAETEAAQQKIRSLEAQLAHVKAAKKVKSKSPSSEAEPKSSASARRPKGASLANPHKKARKYEAVEFGSDDD